MSERVGCEKHHIFDPTCIDCWDADSRRLRTFIEREYTNKRQSERFKRDAIRVLKGDK